MILEEMTWPEVAAIDRFRTVVLAPIASCEQHSHHLPTFTDSLLVGAVAGAVERQMGTSVLLLPVQWLGASDHHQPFGATITASVDHHVDIVADIVESICADGFQRVLVLNGHGGNLDTMRMALRRLQPKYPDRFLGGASYWDLATDELAGLAVGPRKSMGHACEFETAMMMHLHPHLVRVDRRLDNERAVASGLRGMIVAADFSQMTEPGAIGYPTLATAERGKEFLRVSVERTAAACQAILEEELVPGRVRRGWQAPRTSSTQKGL